MPGLLYCGLIQVDFKSLAAERSGTSILDERFENYEVFRLNTAIFTDTLGLSPNAVNFNLRLGDELELPISLVPSEIINRDYILQIASQEGVSSSKPRKTVAYRGEVLGQPGSIVRLTIDNNFFYGFIQLGEDTWFFEPVRFFEGDASDQFIFYHVKDVLDVYDDALCASMELEVNRERLIRQMWLRPENEEEIPVQGRASGNCYLLDIAIASDWLMYQKYGQNTTELENRNIGVLNNVQGNYEGEFDDDIIFNLVTQFISTCSTCDPWTGSNDAGALLGSFRSWGNNGGFGVSFGVASLWTDRNFNGATIGVAYLNAICNSWRYNVLQDFSANAEFLRVLKSHELGHNFSANHDAQGAPFIMAPAVNTSSNWSTQSNNSISSYIQNRSNISNCFGDCVDPEPPIADFYVANDLVCPGSSVHFYDLSENSPNQWEWIFPGGSPSSSTEPFPVVSYEFEGSYDVTLLVFNDYGFDEITITDAVVVSATDGYDMVFYDDFEDGLGNWTVHNPDGGFTWQTTANSYMPIGEQGIGINNFNYTARGQKDAISSPVIDFSGREEIYMEVEYAHRRRNNLRRDSLNIFVSTNGGQTFPHKIYANAENGSGNFATAPDQNVFFIPSNDTEWCVDGIFGSDCIWLDLSDFSGEENIVIRIENVTDNGNNTFINRVMIYSSCEITDPPIPAFLAFPESGCVDLTVDFQDISQNFPNQWLWDFPGGQPAQSEDQNPVIIYSEVGFYDVTLEAFNPAGSNVVTEQGLISVNDIPIPEFSYSVDKLEVAFTNLTQRGNNFFWSFGDGNFSTDVNPVHTYSEGGTYQVSLESDNECGADFFTLTIEIIDAPIADFEVDFETGCAPHQVGLINHSSSNAEEFHWFFPGGNPEESFQLNPTVTYHLPGKYDITLIAINSSGSDTLAIVNAVTVVDTPIAAFELISSEDTLFTTNNSTHAVENLWNFGDGSTSTLSEPVHIYENDGIYEVVLAISNSCGTDTISELIEIATPPAAAFSAEFTEGCVPEEIQFFNESSPNADSLIWIFEGGNPAISHENNPVVTYENAGVFDVVLIAFSNGGTDTIQLDSIITIGQTPVADASFTFVQRQFSFENNSEYANQFIWDFGDGNTSTEVNPEHTFEEDGEYEIVLYAINDCDTSTILLNAQAYALPSASISLNGQDSSIDACAPLSVIFSDNSSGFVESLSWVFEGGSPANSNESEVEVTYSTAGEFDVMLIVNNPGGSDTTVFQKAVLIPEPPEISFVFSVDELSVEFTSQVENADGFIWDFGNGNSSTDANPVFIF
ncbi:MAG: PKD domain-containing protein, partial [Saprospirales bacterium]